MSRLDSHFRLRLPEAERAFIKMEAEKNSRSMTGEIIQAIRSRMQATTERVSQANSSAVAPSHADALQGVGQFHPQHQDC
ncbi:Arc family DNA-binding protein [Xanthobacter sediminis]